MGSLHGWVSGILSVLVASGILGMVSLMGAVERVKGDNVGFRRELDQLDARAHVYGEAIARLEERGRHVSCK